MNINSIVGIKIDQLQAFSQSGQRVPLSKIQVSSMDVVQIKSQENDRYNAVKIAVGNKNKGNKPLQGQIKKAGLKKTPRFLREIRTSEKADLEIGQTVRVEEVLQPGDIVSATGISKGKGYAGVVKKWNFKGGPRTHGQSDRERAPGSIGQSATPGRVYKGKKMSGRMGNEQVTVKNLQVVSIDGDSLLIKGLIPGVKGTLVTIKKTGESKKKIELFSDKKDSIPDEAEDLEEIKTEIQDEEGNPEEREMKETKTVKEETVLEETAVKNEENEEAKDVKPTNEAPPTEGKEEVNGEKTESAPGENSETKTNEDKKEEK